MGKRDETAAESALANEAEKTIATLCPRDRRDLEERFRTATAAILAELREAVAIFNAEGRFHLILDASAASSNGPPQVRHAPRAIDIISELVACLQARENAEPEKP